MDKYNYYVIHCKNNIKRFNNIQMMQKKLLKKINIYDAIIPKIEDQYDLSIYDLNIKNYRNIKQKGELGCYLSHYLLIKSLINSEYEYTVIFEDDFNILIPDLDDKINNLLSIIDIEFDLLFLGTQSKVFGEQYKENIYFINTENKIWGTQGYIINNKKINKILELIKNINFEIDIEYYDHIKKNNLIGLFVNPIYISQNKRLLSTIRPPSNNNLLLLYNQRRKQLLKI
jgi:GR25 family glycosyltransferase involved in LPS biosynthesis